MSSEPFSRIESSHAMDINQLILEDHETFRDDFIRLVDLRGGDKEALQAAWDRIARRLETHARAEEDILYPALLNRIPAESEEESIKALRDHNHIRDAAQDVDKCGVDSGAWWNAIYNCMSVNEEHIAEEESDILPDARINIEHMTRARMAVQWTEYMHEHAEPGGSRHVDPEAFVDQHSGSHP